MSKKLLLALTITLISLIVPIQKAFACHAIGLVNPSSSAVAGGLNVWASSDSPTCGCGVYWLDVEVQCANLPYQNYAFPISYVALNGPVAYTSAQMNKPSCIVQAYPPVTISFAGLCPGTTYKYRMREHHETGVPHEGPWTQDFFFTTPGTTPPVSITSISATPATICPGQTSQLAVNAIGGCGARTYSWTPTASLSGATTQNPVASPSVTTTYTVTVNGQCSGTATSTVTVTVVPAAVAGTASAAPTTLCAGGTTTLTVTGASGNLQWESSSSASGPWTSIPGATSATYTTPALTGTTYYHVIATSPCGTVTGNTVTVTVNPQPVVSATGTDPACFGGTNGSATATVTGATPTGYSWNSTPVQTTATATGLVAMT